jgi:hypothetical protein
MRMKSNYSFEFYGRLFCDAMKSSETKSQRALRKGFWPRRQVEVLSRESSPLLNVMVSNVPLNAALLWFISRCSQRSFTKFQSSDKPQCAETRRTGTKMRTGKAYWRRGRYETEPFSGRFGDPPRTLTRTPSSWPPVTARYPPTPFPPAFPSSWVISLFICLPSTEFAVN